MNLNQQPKMKQPILQRVTMTLLLTVLTAVTAWADFTGSGTQDDPYPIKSANDLLALSEQSLSNDFEGVYFQLENNIAFNKSNSNNFSPIWSHSILAIAILLSNK